MPAIDFPASPALNAEYTFEGRTWRWNGTGWEVKEYPAALLAGTAANPSLYFTGDTNTGLYSPGADQVALSTGGTQKFTIDSLDGNAIIENSFPTIRPSLDLAFALTKTLDPRITFTRASSATYVDSAGLIQTASTDVPRFDHNATTGESLGLLVEEQRTNLLLHNRDLTQAAWVASNITPLKDQAGVDGVASSASKITATNANGTILQTVTSASAARATTAYVKRLTGTGTVEMTQDNGSTWTAVTVTSAWTRVSIPSATVTNPVVGFRLATSGDAIAVDYVQCESGSFFTSAIATTTAAVTRNADVASITGTNFSSWYRQDEGSFYAMASKQAPSNGAIIEGSDGSTFSGLTLSTASWDGVVGTRIDFINRTQTLATGAPFFFQVSGSNLGQVAGAFSASETRFARNGQIAVNTASTTQRMPINSLIIGARIGSVFMHNGCIARLTYWPTFFPSSTLRALTQ